MSPGPPRRRRARPVADAPVDALLGRSEDVAKGWLIALLEEMPLEDAPALISSDLARDAPRVCEAVIRALADDADLRRLESGGALELMVSQSGAIAGAGDAETASRAIDVLRGVVWAALREELPQADADQITELAERLALVAELVRQAALRNPAIGRRANPGGAEADVAAQRAPRILRHAVPPAGPSRSDEPAAPIAFGRLAHHHPVSDEVASAAPPASSPTDAAPPLWLGAVEDEIARADAAGTQLSLLLVELEDAARVEAVEPPAEVTATFGRFAQAVRTVLRRGDILACESDARAWIIARDTGRVGAEALAARVAEAVRAAPWRGAPLTVSVGVAVLGEDGRDRPSMIDAAEEARFAAEARGAGNA